MTIPATNMNIKLPEPTLHRLPWYLAYVKLVQAQGIEYISSTQISKAINVDASQIAKDLSFVNISGKTRVGYEVDSLVYVLEQFLGFTSQHRAIVYGVGRLGAALMHDSGLAQYANYPKTTSMAYRCITSQSLHRNVPNLMHTSASSPYR